MMTKKITCTIFLVLAVFIVHAQIQKDSSNSLAWNEYYKLAWSDFEGKKNSSATGDAGSVVQIKAKPYLVGNKVKYEVTAFFVRHKSWMSDPSDELLAHEQLHFDIAELYARRIRKKIRELSDQHVNDVKIYNAAIGEILKESDMADVRYDMETLHGALLKKQKIWETDVGEQLRSLENFKKHKQVIKAR